MLAVGVLGLLLVTDDRDALAFEGPAVPAIGTATAGAGAGGVLVMGPGALGAPVAALPAGSVVGLGAAAGIAGFALGYGSMAAVCATGPGGDAVDAVVSFIEPDSVACNPYEFDMTGPAGLTFGVNPTLTAAAQTHYGSPSFRINEVSWDSRSDFGEGAVRFGGVLVDSNLDRVSVNYSSPTSWHSSDFAGCAINGPYGTHNRQNSGSWYKSLGGSTCGTTSTYYPGFLGSAGWTDAAISAPYSGASFRYGLSDYESPGANGSIKPNDKLAVVKLNAGTNTTTFADPATAPVYAYVPADPVIAQRGKEIRYRTVIDCESTSGTINTRSATGAWGFQSEGVEVPSTTCLTTEIPRVVEIFLDTVGRRSGQSVPITTRTEIEWEIKPEVLESEPLKDCSRVGANCPTVVTMNPSDPTEVQSCTWGGTSVPSAWCTPPATEAFDPDTGRGTETTPGPTTTAVPSTTQAPPTTTTTVPDESVPPRDPTEPPAPPDDSDNQWSTCMESQIGDDWSHITFNPITWVRALVYYVTAPIICALWWLVVPAGGLDSLWDLFSEPLEDSALIASLRVFVDEWEWNGGCAPVDFGDPLGAVGPSLGEIDVGMCGNLVIGLVWTVLLGLAVLGMAGRLIRTLWTFGQYEKAGYV